MTLYEQSPTDLDSQIMHWNLSRQEHVLMYYARGEGYRNLGLQPLPTQQVSEYRAKQAIQMLLYLRSLKQSAYATERWTLIDTSAELFLTEPKYCFKKIGYNVEVQFDHDPEKSVLLTNWDHIYYQDDNENWHKVAGKVDINGLYYTEVTGDRVYFELYEKHAQSFGNTTEWTVKYKNTTISASVASSSRSFADTSKATDSRFSSSIEEETGHRSDQVEAEGSPTSTTSSTATTRRRRGRGEGEPGSGETQSGGAKRRKSDSESESSYPSPEQVGSRHRSVPRHNLSRLRRLQIEARDPPVILLKGPSNNLKCWRNRCNQRFGHLYMYISTVWNWIGDESEKNIRSRLLISFKDKAQREIFIQTVTFPRGTEYSYGSFDSL